MKRNKLVPANEQRPITRRARGKMLLADISDMHRQEVRLLQERAELHARLGETDLRLAGLRAQQAEKLLEIADADVELPTGRQVRKPPSPAVRLVPDDLVRRQAAEVVGKVIP